MSEQKLDTSHPAFGDAMQQLQALCDRLKTDVGGGVGMMAIFYNREGTNLNVALVTDDESGSEVLRILRTTQLELESQLDKSPQGQMFESATPDAPLTRARVRRVGIHDAVRLWCDGVFAGELMLPEGDGETFVLSLGLRRAP